MIENNWITLVKPNKVDYKISENKKFGTVVIEPLEKGFGTTLGNALRRVLLSSLQGTAITSIKINGVLHEFSTIEGVREDVTDIIMNLKNVTFNSKSNHTQKLTLNVKGPKEVLSSDFDENPEVEIVDKDAVIMNVDSNREVNLEIFLDLNKGYKAAERCGLSIVAHVKNACGGDLEKVKSCVKLTGYVNSTDDFKDQPKIINGASDIIAKIFDKRGEHTRAAVSVNSLPLGVAVEVDAIFELN